MSNASQISELHLPIPQEHGCFPDHFPGAPLVPGALLLKWIMELLAEHRHLQVQYIKQVKFLAPVKPGDQVRLCLGAGKRAQQLGVDAYVGETLVLKGQFEGVFPGTTTGENTHLDKPHHD
jgi:3-hydroxyacyl-[acyl-carrier-protein] dehydratase